MEDEEKEYYIATKDVDGKFLIYTSEGFKLSEIDLINMIRICYVEGRNKALGKKLLSAYKDSTEHKSEKRDEKLKKIGVQIEEKPIKRGKPKTK